jgi:23S rRNA maturation mini-RNase III
MSIATIKAELRDIADHIPESASYGDAMYELYVRMKISKGKKADQDGQIISHDAVKLKFQR